MNPLLSINLCCYNSEKYLRETLDSVINQTFKKWELVIINDGSSDSTEEIILEYIDKGYPIVYHSQKNKGLGFSRNKALELSRGEFIAFLDHDDVWLPEKSELQISSFLNDKDVDFAYSNLYVLKNGRRRVCYEKRQPDGHVFEKFMYHYPVAVLTVMIRRKAIDRLNSLFDQRLCLAEEYDLFMRLLCKSKAVYIDAPLAVYRVHPDMNSIKYFENWPEELAYVIENIKRMDTTREGKYDAGFRYLYAKIGYYRARTEMAKSNKSGARQYLKPYKWTDNKFLLLYLMTYLHPWVWRKVHAHRDGGTFCEPV